MLPLLVLATLQAPPAPLTVRFPRTLPYTGSLPAEVYGQGTRGVVLVGHGGYSSRVSWASTAQLLADSGFSVLVFETGAAIELQAGRETACLYEAPCMARDVLAAVRYAQTGGWHSIAVVGGSAGGGAAAEAATVPASGIARLVLLAPMEVDHPEQVRGPVLVAIGRGDRGSGDRPRLPGVRRQYDQFPGPKDLLVLESDAHGQRLLDAPATAPQLLHRLITFLRQP